MGAWGYDVCENDTALDFIGEAERIAGIKNRVLEKAVVERVTPEYIDEVRSALKSNEADLLSSAISYGSDGVLVYALLWHTLFSGTEEKMKPSARTVVARAIDNAKKNIDDYDDEDARLHSIEQLETKIGAML